jgi:hypothetical protein
MRVLRLGEELYMPAKVLTRPPDGVVVDYICNTSKILALRFSRLLDNLQSGQIAKYIC